MSLRNIRDNFERNTPKAGKELVFMVIFLVVAPLVFLNKDFVLFSKKVLKAFVPLVVAILIVTTTRPMVKFLENKTKLNTKHSVILALITMAVVFSGIIYLLWLPIQKDLSFFFRRVSSRTFLQELAEKLNQTFPNTNFYDMLVNFQVSVSAFFQKNMQSFILIVTKSTSGFMLMLLLSTAIATCLLFEYDNNVIKIKNKLKDKPRLSKIFLELRLGMKAWGRGWVKDQAFIFIATLILLWALGIESWITLSIIMLIFNFVPFVGPIIGGLLIVAYTIGIHLNIAFSQGLGGLILIPANMVILLTFLGITIIQTVESVYWIPKVYSREAQLHPIWILFGISLVGIVFSPFATILTIPGLIFIKVLYNNRKPKNTST